MTFADSVSENLAFSTWFQKSPSQEFLTFCIIHQDHSNPSIMRTNLNLAKVFFTILSNYTYYLPNKQTEYF